MMKTPREFRLVSDGVRYRIEVYDRLWFGFPRWRNALWFGASTEDQQAAIAVLRRKRAEELARVRGYQPVAEIEQTT